MSIAHHASGGLAAKEKNQSAGGTTLPDPIKEHLVPLALWVFGCNATHHSRGGSLTFRGSATQMKRQLCDPTWLENMYGERMRSKLCLIYTRIYA
jgi:hypothetical protein